jgi:hypothetical protein
MDELARTYAGQVDFYVVYTRKAIRERTIIGTRVSSRSYTTHWMGGRTSPSSARSWSMMSRRRRPEPMMNCQTRFTSSVATASSLTALTGSLPIAGAIDLTCCWNTTGVGGEVMPTNIEKNYQQPTLELLKTIRRINTYAGPGSLRDFVRAAPRMIQHRAWQ